MDEIEMFRHVAKIKPSVNYKQFKLWHHVHTVQNKKVFK
jgi:hypothetical protein